MVPDDGKISTMDPNPEKLIRQTLNRARSLKSVALRTDPEASIPTIVEFFRDGELLCQAMGDVDRIAANLVGAISGFNADAVAFTSDAYAHRAQPGHAEVNPLTGKPWQDGEMERMAKENAGVERGLVYEMLMVHYEQRDGLCWQGSVDYKLKRRHFRWGETLICETPADIVARRAEARIPRHIALGWERPSAISSPILAGWTQAQADTATMLTLSMDEIFVSVGPPMAPAPNSERWTN